MQLGIVIGDPASQGIDRNKEWRILWRPISRWVLDPRTLAWTDDLTSEFEETKFLECLEFDTSGCV